MKKKKSSKYVKEVKTKTNTCYMYILSNTLTLLMTKKKDKIIHRYITYMHISVELKNPLLCLIITLFSQGRKKTRLPNLLIIL